MPDTSMARRQFRVLYRKFLFRVVDLETLSAHALGDANQLLGRLAAILVFVSVWLGLGALFFAGARMEPMEAMAAILMSEHFLISTTMLVVGLFAVLSWESTFPDRRDVLVLAPLPVAGSTMFLAKVAAVATSLALTVALLHGVMGWVWPLGYARLATPVDVPALTYDDALPPAPAAALQGILDRDLREQRARGFLAPGTGAGLAVGVYKQGESRVFTYGEARPDSLFEIGSVTKTFTALLLACLVERGEVRLDTPIRELLPEGLVAKPPGGEITLADLAAHRSGLPRMAPGDWQSYLAKRGVSRLPQTEFLYSNFGYVLMGELLARRAGAGYPALLRELVTGPLGLPDTVTTLSSEQQARLLPGYGGERKPVEPITRAAAGAGAIRSSARDLLAYVRANLQAAAGAAPLDSAMRLAHQTRSEGYPGSLLGLAWMHSPSKGTWFHGGATQGFSTMVYFRPQSDEAVVVLLNHGPDAMSRIEFLSEHIRQRLAGAPAISLDTVRVPAAGGAAGVLRWYGAYWFTMFAAGFFLYCVMLGVQGVAAQLPRRWFLRLSGILQIGAFCLIVCGYFLQPAFGGLSDMNDTQVRRALAWNPTYWFLGVFHSLNGSPHPLLTPLGHRGWWGLAAAAVVAGLAYTFSYLRSLRKIVEEPDIAPGLRRPFPLPRFGSAVQTAIGQFAVRTLCRSRQHRLILAFYLGLGFAFLTLGSRTPGASVRLPETADRPWTEAYVSILAGSIIMTALAVVGTRIVFALPLDLRANWVFQIVGLRAGTRVLEARRRALLAMAAGPVWLATAFICFSRWPWSHAAGHLALLGLLALLLVELCLLGFRKIPFTCSYLPGKVQMHMVLFAALTLMYFTVLGVRYERTALQDWRLLGGALAALALIVYALRWWNSAARPEEDELNFEERPAAVVTGLGLHRDGFMPTGGAG